MKRNCIRQLLFCIFVFYFVEYSVGTNAGFTAVGHAFNDAVDENDIWIQDCYKDVFGDPTEELYFVNRTPFAGTFNSAEYDDSPLSANVIIDDNDLYFVLYENESVKVKNRSEEPISYNISVKAADGSKFSALGSMQGGSDRIVVERSKKDRIINSLLEGTDGGKVIFYIENEIQQFTNYLFAVDCANLSDLFYGDQYREALRLIENGNQLDATQNSATSYDSFNSSVEELLEYQNINPHVIGLLDIPGTEIHYPILQHPTEDNYYLLTTIDGKTGYPGSIYTNLMEGQNFDTFNTVIYGMTLTEGGMFTSLSAFDDLEYMKKHREIHIYTNTEDHSYIVCANVIYDDRYITYVYDDAKEGDREAFIRSLRNGMWLDDVTVDASSHIITLSTSIGGLPNLRRLIIAVEQETGSIPGVDQFFSLCNKGTLAEAKEWLNSYQGVFPDRDEWIESLDTYLPYCGNWNLSSGDQYYFSSMIDRRFPIQSVSSKVLLNQDTARLVISLDNDEINSIEFQCDFGDTMFTNSEHSDDVCIVALNNGHLICHRFDNNWKPLNYCEFVLQTQ